MTPSLTTIALCTTPITNRLTRIATCQTAIAIAQTPIAMCATVYVPVFRYLERSEDRP